MKRMISHWAALTDWGWKTPPGFEVVLPPTVITMVSACGHCAKKSTEICTTKRFIRCILSRLKEKWVSGIRCRRIIEFDVRHLKYIFCLLLTDASSMISSDKRTSLHEGKKDSLQEAVRRPRSFYRLSHGSGCDIINILMMIVVTFLEN